MFGLASDHSDTLATRRKHRRLVFALVLAAAVGWIAGNRLGYPLVGVATYWLGVLAALAVWKGTDVSIQDERDCDLERRASQSALLTIGAVGILTAPALAVLEETTSYTVPAIVDHLLIGYAALYATFGVWYAWYRFQR